MVGVHGFAGLIFVAGAAFAAETAAVSAVSPYAIGTVPGYVAPTPIASTRHEPPSPTIQEPEREAARSDLPSIKSAPVGRVEQEELADEDAQATR